MWQLIKFSQCISVSSIFSHNLREDHSSTWLMKTLFFHVLAFRALMLIRNDWALELLRILSIKPVPQFSKGQARTSLLHLALYFQSSLQCPLKKWINECLNMIDILNINLQILVLISEHSFPKLLYAFNKRTFCYIKEPNIA